jgi:hypothetical protein
MLIEVKVKVARIIDGKTRKRTETWLKDDCELFVEAEQAVMQKLTEEQEGGLIDEFEIQSLKISPIKEVCDQWLDDYITSGYPAFIATLKDIFHADDGTEKTLKYKVLLWASNHSEALRRVTELSREGYDMQIEGIKQVDYEYLTPTDNGTD